MSLGRKTQAVTLSPGVKNSKPYSSLGVKQSHNPRLDIDALIRNNTPNGIINNESNGNDNNYQPIKGIQLANHKSSVNLSRNNIEKAHKIKRSSDNNHFT
jgi:hypothetical protein